MANTGIIYYQAHLARELASKTTDSAGGSVPLRLALQRLRAKSGFVLRLPGVVPPHHLLYGVKMALGV